jgi:hypothetical protein
MLKLLQYIIFGHVHVWETQRHVELEGPDGGLGSRAECKCKTCGAWKKFDLI